ncbi:uncharacterized protein [Physcomitrium patens]|uniref:uncharacterized protein n=1 Tax=Physcomitrium patens TaxID=3218 RepID=UPI003CCD826C
MPAWLVQTEESLPEIHLVWNVDRFPVMLANAASVYYLNMCKRPVLAPAHLKVHRSRTRPYRLVVPQTYGTSDHKRGTLFWRIKPLPYRTNAPFLDDHCIEIFCAFTESSQRTFHFSCSFFFSFFLLLYYFLVNT